MRSTRQLSRAYMRPVSQAARLRATFLLLTVPAIASSQSTDPQPLAMRLQCPRETVPSSKAPLKRQECEAALLETRNLNMCTSSHPQSSNDNCYFKSSFESPIYGVTARHASDSG